MELTFMSPAWVSMSDKYHELSDSLTARVRHQARACDTEIRESH